VDCGTAEQEVFARLNAHRRGKWGQEFFEVDLALAKETIKVVCSEVDQRGAVEPLPAPGTLPGEVAYPPPSRGDLRPDRVPSGFAARRSRWRQSGRRPRRWWTAVAIVFGVVVILAAAQGEQKSQPANSRPASQAGNSAPKVAKPAVGAKQGAPAQAGHDVARPDGPRQAAASHAAPESDGIGDSSVPPSPSPGAPNHVGSSSDVAKAVGKARDGDAPGVSQVERTSNGASCSSERMMQDPAAYSRCLNNRAP
jgi:hypothetical protein